MIYLIYFFFSFFNFLPVEAYGKVMLWIYAKRYTGRQFLEEVFTCFQDFSGTDVVYDTFNKDAVGDILDLLKSTIA